MDNPETLPELDSAWVRAQFPAFSEPSLEGFAHFENAGGSYACGAAVEQLNAFYRKTKVQPFYAFTPSRRAGAEMVRARARLARWLGVKESEVHFGPSTSQNSYVIAQALRETLKPGDEIIVTNQDHEANIGVWRRLEQAGAVIREWQVNPETAELDLKGLEALLSQRTRVVAFTHCSNIVGSIHPVREWVDRIHEAGALAFVDGVSFAPHGLPDVGALGADLYLFSLYKVYGPHLGVMVLRDQLNQRLPNQGHFFNAARASARFTPAGPDHAQIAAVNGVLDYFGALHRHHFGADPDEQAPVRVAALQRDREKALLPELLDFLRSQSGVRIVGKQHAKGRAPTVSFTVQGRLSQEVARQLGERDIGVGVGNCYAYRLIEALDIDPDDGVVRVSFVHYTSRAEIQRLMDTLDSLI